MTSRSCNRILSIIYLDNYSLEGTHVKCQLSNLQKKQKLDREIGSSKNRPIRYALGASGLSQATRDIFHRKSWAVDLGQQTKRNFKLRCKSYQQKRPRQSQ